MNTPHLVTGSPSQIVAHYALVYPEIPRLIEEAKRVVPFIKRQIDEYQAAPLYALARPFDKRGARFLEIGTAHGFSAFVLALAAPKARITTLNPKPWEAERARESLAGLKNVELLEIKSWDYLDVYGGEPLDLVFVDGDHGQVERDLPWFNWLKVGGLLLFHDYTPAGGRRATPHVYEVVDDFAGQLGRPPDVLVVDETKNGLAGFYRREGEAFSPFQEVSNG